MKSDTLAMVVAGRSIDSYVTTYGMLKRMRSIAAEVPDLAVVAATDETVYDTPPNDNDSLNARVVIGVVAVRSQSEIKRGVSAVPMAVEVDAVQAALEKARAIDAAVWTRLAAVLPYKVLGYTAAARRASLSPEQREQWAGVAFNGPDLLDTTERVHLVANGPLSTAILARGTCEPLPQDDEEDGDDENVAFAEDRLDGLVFVKGNNERPAVAVRGQELARVSIEGHGAIALPPDVLSGELYLLAQYD